ncbi:MAG TPA: hypothetical protein VMG38_03280 [Trebonia sp.]|nr:hypothetical protein [Trebonia sp.]
MFRRTASELSLDAEVIDDGETAVSELAANTLHVKCGKHSNGACSMGRVNGQGAEAGDPTARGRGPGGGAGGPWVHADPAGAGAPDRSELWLYLRGSGEACELVCKVFDAYPGWAHGVAPGQGGLRAGADTDAMSGRGLEVVHELSHGRWGYHLTRSRLEGWSLRGKAVWFTTPAPFAKNAVLVPWGQPRGATSETLSHPMAAAWGRPEAGSAHPMSASEAMGRLEAQLVARGFGDSMVRADDPVKDMAVLSVCGDLTVWCRGGCAWLRAPGLDGLAWGYGDLVEVAEQVVAAHETFCVTPELAGAQARMHA